jgi:hypothetical protein
LKEVKEVMNSSSAENPSLGDDEKGIIEILKSMGIDQFDPMVPVALNEYARSMFSS